MLAAFGFLSAREIPFFAGYSREECGPSLTWLIGFACGGSTRIIRRGVVVESGIRVKG